MVTPLIIVCLMSSPLLLALLISGVRNTALNRRRYACWGLGLTFIFFFIGHMMKTQGMVEMLPPWMPLRIELIYITGVLELAIGIALFIPRFQRRAAQLSIVVFVVFFPANIYAATSSIGLGGHQCGPVYLWIRAPLQILLIVWAYVFCLDKPIPDWGVIWPGNTK